MSAARLWHDLDRPPVRAGSYAGEVVLLCSALGCPASEVAERTGVDRRRVRGAVRDANGVRLARNRPRALELTVAEEVAIASLPPLLWAQWMLAHGVEVDDGDVVAAWFALLTAREGVPPFGAVAAARGIQPAHFFRGKTAPYPYLRGPR